MGSTVIGLPCWPGSLVLWEGFPFVGGMREVLGSKHSGGGNCEEFVVEHQEIGMGKRALCFPQAC